MIVPLVETPEKRTMSPVLMWYFKVSNGTSETPAGSALVSLLHVNNQYQLLTDHYALL